MDIKELEEKLSELENESLYVAYATEGINFGTVCMTFTELWIEAKHVAHKLYEHKSNPHVWAHEYHRIYVARYMEELDYIVDREERKKIAQKIVSRIWENVALMYLHTMNNSQRMKDAMTFKSVIKTLCVKPRMGDYELDYKYNQFNSLYSVAHNEIFANFEGEENEELINRLMMAEAYKYNCECLQIVFDYNYAEGHPANASDETIPDEKITAVEVENICFDTDEHAKAVYKILIINRNEFAKLRLDWVAVYIWCKDRGVLKNYKTNEELYENFNKQINMWYTDAKTNCSTETLKGWANLYPYNIKEVTWNKFKEKKGASGSESGLKKIKQLYNKLDLCSI